MAGTHIRRFTFALGLLGAGIAILSLRTADAQTAGTVVMQPLPASDTMQPIGPGRPANIHVLSPADHNLFVQAFAAAAKADWNQALTLGAQGQDGLARQLLQWRYALDKNSGATFAQIDAAVKMAGDWPLKNTLYARAEAAITPDMTAPQIIAWFGNRTPASSLGRVRLGEALVASGQESKGAPMIRQGWSEGSFDQVTEDGILAKDASYLTPESDKARLDAELWRGEVTLARRQLSRVDARTAALAQARIALEAGLPHAKPFLDKVSDIQDPTLLYVWARQLRLDHKADMARTKLMAASPTLLAKAHTARWWAEVNIEARETLAAGDPRAALALVDHAMLPISDEYAEQQFLGGFIALRFLKDPARALVYFQRLAANVARPISKSRADYWQGRAYEALSDNDNAYAHYRLAAAYPETFYGQLAIARTQIAPVLHLNDIAVEPAAKAEIESDPLMPAMKVLADLGQEGDLSLFAGKEAEVYSSPRHLKQVLMTLSDWGYPEIAVRLAKSASYAGAPMLAFTHPVLTPPPYPGPGNPPSPALVLGLIRQETEFNPYAVSSANARGLMQVMLASARTDARVAKLPYRPDALLSDPSYNMQLGMVEIQSHIAAYDGSTVLAIASYDAGPGNVKKWLASNGDPRTANQSGGTDPIDWIEQIPFAETRNYVQRVLENMEVYRDRLAGSDQPLAILTDLYAPVMPPGTVLPKTQ